MNLFADIRSLVIDALTALTDLGRHKEAHREAQTGLAEALSVLNPATWQLRMGIALTRLGRCLLYTSPSPRDKRQSRMPSSA